MNLDIPNKNRLYSQDTSAPSMYDIAIDTIDGNAIDFSSFKGKKILFVNVASKCGFTKQYKELQKLRKYIVSDKGTLIDHYYSITSPLSKKITKHL